MTLIHDATTSAGSSKTSRNTCQRNGRVGVEQPIQYAHPAKFIKSKPLKKRFKFTGKLCQGLTHDRNAEA